MRAGLLKDLVGIEQIATAPNTWESVTTIRGELKPLGIRDRTAAEQQAPVAADVDHLIRIRYGSDVTAGMRAVIDGRYFYIRAPLEMIRRREIHLMCREEVLAMADYAASHGTAATFRQVSLGAYDVEAGTKATTPSDTTVHGILLEYDVSELGVGIDTDDRKYRIAATEISVTPDTEDQLLIGGVTYEIVNVGRVEKRGVVEFWELRVRRVV